MAKHMENEMGTRLSKGSYGFVMENPEYVRTLSLFLTNYVSYSLNSLKGVI